MKIKIWILITAIPLLGTAQQINYSVKGRFGKLKSPLRVYMTYVPGDKDVRIDSTTTNNGSFVFEGKINTPVKARITVDHTGTAGRKSQDVIEIYLEKAPVIITAKDSLRYAAVKGGIINADHQVLKTALKVMDKDIAIMSERYIKAQARTIKDPQEAASLDSGWNAINKKRKEIHGRFISTHPSSGISLDVLKVYNGPMPDYKDALHMFNTLAPSIQRSSEGQAYLFKLKETAKTAVGNMAPAFSQKDTTGIPVSLSAFKGKYVLLDFWASWCAPCRAENPEVVKAFERYKDKNFTIIGISLDNASTAAKWRAAITADKLQWTQLSDLQGWKNEVAKLYSVEAIPQNFLIDPSGKIIAKNLRGEEQQATLQRYIF